MDVATMLVILTTVVGPAIGWLTAQYFNSRNVQLSFTQELRDSYDSLLVAYKKEIDRLSAEIANLRMMIEESEQRHKDREQELLDKIRSLKKDYERTFRTT